MARSIVITSGKGGVGKTSICANLALALCKLGQRVLAVDADFGFNNLDVALGVENNVLYDVGDVFIGRCRTKQALIKHNEFSNLFILPSNSTSANDVGPQNLKVIIEQLRSSFDYVLIDSPAGIDAGFHRAVSCADEAIVVTTPSLISLRDADKVVAILQSYKLAGTKLVINKVRGDLVVAEKMLKPTDIEQMLKTKLIGIIPDDDEIFLNLSNQKSARAVKAFKILANNVHKNCSVLFDTTSRYLGFFGSIKRSLKGLV